MTEYERTELARNARIFTAPADITDGIPKKSIPKKGFGFSKGRAAAIFICGAVLILTETNVPEHTDSLCKCISLAAYKISRFCAEIQLSRPSSYIKDFFADNISENMNKTADHVNNENNEKITQYPQQPVMSAENDMLMLSRGSKKMPSSQNEELFVEDIPILPDKTADLPLPYPDSIESNDGAISRITYTSLSADNYIDLPDGGQIRNITALSNEEVFAAATAAPDYKIKLDAPENEPQVLIMHTHTTESYEPYSRSFYDADFQCRTTDSSMNMVAVGDEMAKVFDQKGIRVIHDTTIHDHPSYNGSYDRSRVTVLSILEKYPSVKVVLDVHRDAIERESGERIAPFTKINGRSCAQVMLICGCDDGTMNMPDCMKNLASASLFQQYMEKKYPTFTRPMLYDYRQYNQDLTTGSVLIEVGGHANSIDEALYAGQLAADAIADSLISISDRS